MTNNNINNEKWIEKLIDKVNSHNESVPENGWKNLEQELAATPKPLVLIPNHWRQMAAAAAVLVAIFGAALYFLYGPDTNEIDQKVAEVVVLPAEIDSQDIRPLDQYSVAPQQTMPQKQVAHSSSKRKIASTHSTLVSKINETEKQTAESAKEVDSSTENKEVKKVEAKTEIKKKENTKKQVKHAPSSKDKQHIPAPSNTRKNKELWAFGASIGNAGAFSNNREFAFSGRAYQVSTNLDESDLANLTIDQTIVFKNGIPVVYDLNDVIQAKHQLPITVRLNVRKALKRRFSIETGLTFTLLSSDVTLAGSPEVTNKQKLYYLGIPVKGNWDFLQSRFFTLYLSAGGQIEKCVSAKTVGENTTNKPWQFSVMGGVGAQVNITKNFGIYAEPGVAYYFKDNSSLQTIRKEHPFNFNLVTGLRLTY